MTTYGLKIFDRFEEFRGFDPVSKPTPWLLVKLLRIAFGCLITLLLMLTLAYADTVGVLPSQAPPAVDLTGIAVATVSGVFSLLGILGLAWIRNHVNDQAAAATLENALQNGLGAMQQASTAAVMQAKGNLKVVFPPSAPPQLVVGVQYALDHAGVEAARLGVTPIAIADKLIARLGVKQIETNIAVSGSDSQAAPSALAPSATPTVLSKVPGRL
jgi:hypothetical protein